MGNSSSNFANDSDKRKSQRTRAKNEKSSSTLQSSSSSSKMDTKNDKFVVDGDQAVVDAIVVDEEALAGELRKEALGPSRSRAELYSPEWLFAIAKKHAL